MDEETILLEDEKKFLTEVELQNLEIQTQRMEIFKQRVETLKEKVNVKRLTKQEYKLRSDILEFEIQELTERINKQNEFMSSNNLNYNNIKKALADKYDLPKNWGFNPQTGEIILE